MPYFEFVTGMVTMGHLVASLFFLRFWRRTGDWLFAAFSIAFLCFALTQALVVLTGIPREEQSLIYLLRLAGFALLAAAIIGKNWNRRGASRPH
jgi:hypothetical protein